MRCQAAIFESAPMLFRLRTMANLRYKRRTEGVNGHRAVPWSNDREV